MPIRQYKNPAGQKGWQIDVSHTRHKRTRRKSLVVYTALAEARRIERAMKTDIETRHGEGTIMFPQLVEDYLEHSRKTKRSHRTDVSRVKPLLRYFGNVPAAAITLDDVVDFQIRRGKDRTRRGTPVMNSSINIERTLLSTIFVYGIRSGRLPVTTPNPVAYAPHLPVSFGDDREITDGDLVKICAGMSSTFRRAVLLARFTGLRITALLALDWSQVVDGVIHPTEAQRMTTKKVGRIPIREGLWPVMGEPRRRGRVLNAPRLDHVRYAIARARKNNGIYFTFHDFRRSFSTELLRGGLDEIYRKVFMGHSFSSVHERYVRITDADLKIQLARLGSCAALVNEVLENTQKPE